MYLKNHSNMEIIISQPLEKEAKDYALKSRSYTSNRHDFHEGGLEAKERKMFEGKLGEKAIKQFFTERNIKFKEDTTSFDEADFSTDHMTEESRKHFLSFVDYMEEVRKKYVEKTWICIIRSHTYSSNIANWSKAA